MSEETSCGFVSVLGLPNAGKSTLINALVGAKVSIVSRKVQTTRSRVLGILIHDKAQIVLIDTPGIFEPKKTLEKAMVTAAWGSVQDADVIVHLVDVSDKKAVAENEIISDRLQECKNCILVLNKTDRVAKPDLLALSQDLNEKLPYKATFMISALKGDGLPDLLQDIALRLPKGPWMFPEDQITDIPMRMLAAEITREKLFDQLHQELPYAVMVETENWEKFDNGSVKIDQVVYVQKDNQKGIVLGKGGTRIKKIGMDARLELEDMMGGRVHLKLFVKVKENWTENAESYQLMGLDLPK
ncbi:MAG: GTPase Era [Micavibrio sp.]|nr:MAG: GTPase Era [Micavibrio sp.]